MMINKVNKTSGGDTACYILELQKISKSFGDKYFNKLAYDFYYIHPPQNSREGFSQNFRQFSRFFRIIWPRAFLSG